MRMGVQGKKTPGQAPDPGLRLRVNRIFRKPVASARGTFRSSQRLDDFAVRHFARHHRFGAVVFGGIHINVKGEATPLANVVFLFIGALVANLFGTTGASMLLIRPWLRMNKYRITAHHVVFFIFIVSNVGGCLTPIGDPPLFLGYLQGIPFWWVAEHCWPIWAVGVGILLAMFYVVDRLNFGRAPREVRERETIQETWRFEGLSNLFFLAVILGAVFVSRPIFVREALMVAAAA